MNNLDFARVAITARLREQSNTNVRDDAADLARLQAAADQHLRDNLPRPESHCERDALADAGFDESELTNDDITEWGAEVGLDKTALVARLRKYVADADAMAA